MHGLESALRDAGPRLVVLLVCSPLIGAALLLMLRGHSAARQTAMANSVLTALLSGLVAVAYSTSRAADQASPFIVMIPWFHIDDPQLSCVLSLGIDPLNLGPLTWIPWLAWGIVASNADQTASKLLLEFCLLATYAAQDAVTFSFAGLLTIGVLYVVLGHYGLEDRRMAAGRFFRGQVAAQLLWWFGLVGLAVAAAWSRQEVVSRIPAVDFRWTTLVQILPLVVRQSVAGFQYWSLTSPMLFAVLLTGVLLRGPWLPFDRGMSRWLNAVSPHAAALIVGGWPLIAGYGWLRFIRPAFSDDVREAQGLLVWWTAVSLMVAAWRCWTATDLRQFATAWCLALQSLGWLGLIDGSPVGTTSGWLILQAAGWSAAVWMVLLDHCRGLRAALAAMACLLPLWTIPVLGTVDHASPVEALLLHHLWPTGLAIVGWFLIGWAAVRRIVGWFKVRTSSEADPVPALSFGEWLALLPLAGCLLMVVLFPSLWRGQ